MHTIQHQYIERDTGGLYTEMSCSAGCIHFFSSEPVRDKAAWLFRLLTSRRRFSHCPALLRFDLPHVIAALLFLNVYFIKGAYVSSVYL